MSTLKQAEAVAAIYKSQGKDYDFDEINAWDGKGKFSQKASDIISANYRSYDKAKEGVMEKQKVEKTEAVGMSVMPQPEMAAVAVQPQAVIEHAQTAAKALTDVLKKKAKLVMINNERYLEYEDWQTLGRFYGISAGAASTEEINRNGRLVGFSAKAEAWQNGVLVSSAEASCMREERNWATKPEFQLRSMAQTRACAKALRNVLGWVAVLAGYKPTPAEEMDNNAQTPTKKSEFLATAAQRKKIFTIANAAGMTEEGIKDWVKETYKLESFTQLSISQASEAIGLLQKRLDEVNAEAVEPEEVQV
jgi:hypothetical protein